MEEKTVPEQVVGDLPETDKLTLKESSGDLACAEAEKQAETHPLQTDPVPAGYAEENVPAPESRPEAMKEKLPSNRFSTDRLQIHEDMEGVVLASFTQRTVALLIDVSVIFALATYWWMAVLVFIVMRLFMKRLKSTFTGVHQVVDEQLNSIDNRLMNYQVEQKLRKRFKRHLKIYLNIVIYLPIVLAVLYLGVTVAGLIKFGKYDDPLISLLEIVNNYLNPLNFVIGGLVAVTYFGIMNYWYQGQTLGKRLLGIQVRKLNGKPLTFRGSIERATGYTASGSLFFYGFFQFFWDPNRQTTHDKITETIVVVKEN